LARRDPYSRWNRLPPVYRSGEHKIPGPDEDPQRIILYLKGAILDLAEALAEKVGFATVQEYCADLLGKAIEIERVKHHVADVEARRGRLEGLSEITDDVGYLSEWQERSDSREAAMMNDLPDSAGEDGGNPELTVPVEVLDSVVLPDQPTAEPGSDHVPAEPAGGMQPEEAPPEPRPKIRIAPSRTADGPVVLERMIPEVVDGTPVAILWSHVAPGRGDTGGFLPVLRRGQAVAPSRVAELLEALGRIEADQRGAPLIERGLAYALHRLGLEAQVLLTEAWPGVFDDSTVGAIRSVQDRIERILSGQGGRDEPPGAGQAAETQS
jgi:hypothetical protein